MAYVLIWNIAPPRPRAKLVLPKYPIHYTLEAHPAVAYIAGGRKTYERDFAPVVPEAEGSYAISQKVLDILLARCPSQVSCKPIDVRRSDNTPGVVPVPMYWLLLNLQRESLVLPEEFDGDLLNAIRKKRYESEGGRKGTYYTVDFTMLRPEIGRKQQLRKSEVLGAHIWFERLNGQPHRGSIFVSDDLADSLMGGHVDGPDIYGHVDEI